MGRSGFARKWTIALLAGVCGLWFTALPAAADAGASATTLTAPAFVLFGSPLTLTAQVAGTGVPTGTVTFLAGVTPIASAGLDATGTAVATISTLAIGSYSITASYGGDTNNAPGVSSPSVVAVLQKTKTDLLVYSRPKVPATTWTPTTPLILVANVIRTKPVGTKKLQPTGTVTFNVDGVQTIVPVGGLHDAGLEFPNGLPLGTHTAFAHFNGDPIFGPSTSPTRKVKVNRNLTTAITDSPDPVVAGADVTYTLTVTNNGLAAAPGAQVVDTLPAGTTLVSATAAGGCTGTGPVTCSLGTLALHASHTATIVVQSPPVGGPITDTATALAGMNNVARETTTVDPSP